MSRDAVFWLVVAYALYLTAGCVATLWTLVRTGALRLPWPIVVAGAVAWPIVTYRTFTNAGVDR